MIDRRCISGFWTTCTESSDNAKSRQRTPQMVKQSGSRRVANPAQPRTRELRPSAPITKRAVRRRSPSAALTTTAGGSPGMTRTTSIGRRISAPDLAARLIRLCCISGIEIKATQPGWRKALRPLSVSPIDQRKDAQRRRCTRRRSGDHRRIECDP